MRNIAQIVNVPQSLRLTDGPTGQNCVKTTSCHALALCRPHRLWEPEHDPAAIAFDPGGGDVGEAGPALDGARDAVGS